VGSANKGIPFAIEGTTSNPHFIPNIGGMAGNVASGAVKSVTGKLPAGVQKVPTSKLGGLFGKKK